MSQWFGGQGRKDGKSTPEEPSGVSRGRSTRPLKSNGASNSRPQPNNFNQKPDTAWNPNLEKPREQVNRQVTRPGNQLPPQSRRSVRESSIESDEWTGHTQNYRDGLSSQQPNASYQEGYQDGVQEQYQEDNPYERPASIEFKKRLVALIFDFLVCYVGACGVMLIPFLNAYLSVNVVLSLFLLTRDFLFEGRGIGKNLMGLQVVDAQSGGVITLKQSALRQVVLLGPYLVTQIMGILLHFIPFAGFNEVVMTIVNAVGAIYVIIIIPMEVYRAYTRADGQRLGDQIAQTEVVESNMDFSRPVPRGLSR